MPAAIMGMEHMRAMKLRIAVILLLTPMVVRLRLVEKRVCVCFALFLVCFGVKELEFIYAFYA